MKTKQLTIGAMMLALIIICSQLSIPMWPVPITLQTFAVLLTGVLLGSNEGAIVLCIYTIMGFVGLPVFAGFHGGIPPATAGYILGFIVAAMIAGMYYQIGIWALILGNIWIYIPGLFILHAVLHLTWWTTLIYGLFPFVVGDAIKIMLVNLIAGRLLPYVRS